MFLKNTSRTSLICLLASYPFVNALAYDGPIPSRYAFNGPTVGVGIGANTFMTNLSQDYILSGMSSAFYDNNHMYSYGIMGNILAGYGNVFPSGFYLGTELGLNIFQPTQTSFRYAAQATSTIINGIPVAVSQASVVSTTQVKRNALEPTLDIKMGGLVAPNVLAFLRGGINYNNLEIKSQSLYQSQSLIPPVVSTSSLFTTSQSKKSVGLRGGLGMEYMVTSRLGVSANYIYTFYRNVNTNASGTINAVACDVFEGCVASSAAAEETHKARMNDQQVLLELIYHIG